LWEWPRGAVSLPLRLGQGPHQHTLPRNPCYEASQRNPHGLHLNNISMTLLLFPPAVPSWRDWFINHLHRRCVRCPLRPPYKRCHDVLSCMVDDRLRSRPARPNLRSCCRTSPQDPIKERPPKWETLTASIGCLETRCQMTRMPAD
jgi:hypothetical protein